MRRQLLRDGARCAKYPQEDGVVVVADQDWIWGIGEPVPTDHSELVAFVSRVSLTPKGKRYAPLRAKTDSDSQLYRPGWGRDWSTLRREPDPDSTSLRLRAGRHKVNQMLEDTGATPSWQWSSDPGDEEWTNFSATTDQQTEALLLFSIEDLIVE